MMRKLRNLFGAVVLLVSTGAHGSFISYGLAVQDIGAPTTFAFLFGTPILGQSGPSTWSFTGSMTMVDQAGDGVSASNSGAIPEYWQLQVWDGNNVVHVVDDVGGVAALVGPGPFNFAAGGSFDCSALTGGCVGMAIYIQFTLSGGNDGLNTTGRFDLNTAAVPEPATLLLLGLGVAGLALARRRGST